MKHILSGQTVMELGDGECSLVLALGDSPEPPTEFRILSKGQNRTKKGTIVFDDKSERAVLGEYAAHGTDLMIDWEHKSILTAGTPVDGGKAAGWFKPAVRNGELWASEVQWTPAAKSALQNREYRYFSPVVFHDKDGRVLRLVNVALTNLPATQGLRALVASDAPVPSKETIMENETEVALLSALSADSLSAALGTITALKEEAGKVKMLGDELTLVRLELATRDVSRLLADAKQAGKLTDAELPVLLEQGIKDVKWLSSYLAVKTASPVATPEAKEPKQGEEALTLSDVDQTMVRLFNVKPESFAQTRKLAAAGALNGAV